MRRTSNNTDINLLENLSYKLYLEYETIIKNQNGEDIGNFIAKSIRKRQF